MKRFEIKADAEFYAENIDDAFQKLVDYFYSLTNQDPNKPMIPPIFEKGYIYIQPQGDNFTIPDAKKEKREITDTERLDFELSHTTEWMGFTGSKDYWELEVWIGCGDKRHSETFEAPTKRECIDKAILYMKEIKI